MHYRTAQPRLRLLLPGTAITLALALVVASSVALNHSAAAKPNPDATKFVGRWNYDHPDRKTMRNIAESDLPGRTQVPQVGDIVLTADGPDRIVGRTNVGCVWRFRVAGTSLELDPARQTCRNPTSNALYTIDYWTIAVRGNHASERLSATTYHDREYTFALLNGARSRTVEFDGAATARFAGAWEYDPANETTGVNMRSTVHVAEDATRSTVVTPEQGTLRITEDHGNRMTVRTDDGCEWAMIARGNVATLDPAVQSCTKSRSAALILRSWVISTDGQSQAAMLSGVDERGRSFSVSVGELHKR